MKVEIWSDVVCPWCYIGKVRFEKALGLFAHRDEVEVVFRSFELDPNAEPSNGETVVDRLSRKYNVDHDQAVAMVVRTTATAATESLEFDLAEAVSTNTHDAHRLLHLAAAHGVQSEAKARLLRAHFSEKRDVGDPDTLVELLGEVGIDEASVRNVLASDEFSDAVRIEQETARSLGVTGVPFFVIDRAYGIGGAQPVDVMVDALEEAWAARSASG